MSSTRRRFLAKASALSVLSFSGFSSFSSSLPDKETKKQIQPNRLRPGDKVGLISPSGAIYESEPYEVATEILEYLELEVVPSKHLRDRYGHLAGRDEDRANEINDMFADPEIKGIFCLRGGSGAARILDMLDYKTIRKNPKVFIGYSDITAFLMAIYAKTGLITFHGPLAVSDWNEFSVKHLKKILLDGLAPTLTNPPKGEDQYVQTKDRIRTIQPGTASGELVGGNLSVLTGIVGSEYLPDWKGKILFLEEVGENIYRVDRMMSQLKLAGILDQISGFVFGKCTDCNPGSGYGSLTLEEVIDHYIKPLEIPAFSGSMIGHIDKNFTLPVGGSVTIDAELGVIQLNEPATI